MVEEKIIKKEQLMASGLRSGYLILTSKRLYFICNTGFFKQKLINLFDIPIENIINVEAEKSHLTTEYILKIRYKDGQKELEAKCIKSGWNIWKGRDAFKIEANLFNEWVRAVEDVRAGNFNKNKVSELEELEKLAELKNKGIITEDEFTKKKSQILGL